MKTFQLPNSFPSCNVKLIFNKRSDWPLPSLRTLRLRKSPKYDFTLVLPWSLLVSYNVRDVKLRVSILNAISSLRRVDRNCWGFLDQWAFWQWSSTLLLITSQEYPFLERSRLCCLCWGCHEWLSTTPWFITNSLARASIMWSAADKLYDNGESPAKTWSV